MTFQFQLQCANRSNTNVIVNFKHDICLRYSVNQVRSMFAEKMFIINENPITLNLTYYECEQAM